ncbi:hypothetical protein LX16_0333 [Stackebrandtia albiflava]|uniref:Uncharacterized protein n=1 Tax=Stackebrandtia albiflava TaxID=406432 RepID=A0A562VA09_9ACTN|nr:hypothetical protein [Stackebrandtia albiflava]TWJ14647.1 hypothetical protein LX16_0333 [Stackebrandtia albiflava]
MSVNVGVDLRVEGLDSVDQAHRVAAAVTEFAATERIDRREFPVRTAVVRRRPIVRARTPHPLIIGGNGDWDERFEAGVRAAITGVAPDAVIMFEYDYPDFDL